MKYEQHSLWRFFGSVKLALITLIILAVVSVLGTLIKQGQEMSYYTQEYGDGLAKFLEFTDLTNMYNSWWFVAVLCLLAMNLLVCSIERVPRAWRQAFSDHLSIEPDRIAKMGQAYQLTSPVSTEIAIEQATHVLHMAGWKSVHRRNQKDATLLFCQKYAWSRFGVYIVHFSILLILIGAILGSLFGYQAYVFLPEGEATEKIYMRKTKEAIPLGFKLHNEKFEKSYYPNGMVKQYHADLAVIDTDLVEPFRKSIIVNDPLSYGGLTFYLGDSYPMEAFYIVILNRNNGKEQAFRVPADQDVSWDDTQIRFRIDELKRDQDGFVESAKIQFASGHATPAEFWMRDRNTVNIPQLDGDYVFSLRQLQSTLLLVTKDPGVWTVYAGFVIMVIGLAISFFLAHKRIWMYVEPDGQSGHRLLVAGQSNKHKPAFERHFSSIVEGLEQTLPSTDKGGKKDSKRKKLAKS